MSNNKKEPLNENSSKEKVISEVFREARQDVSLPWDKDWLKKSRDDSPDGDAPMPENPLLRLKPTKPADQNEHESGKDRKDNP